MLILFFYLFRVRFFNLSRLLFFYWGFLGFFWIWLFYLYGLGFVDLFLWWFIIWLRLRLFICFVFNVWLVVLLLPLNLLLNFLKILFPDFKVFQKFILLSWLLHVLMVFYIRKFNFFTSQIIIVLFVTTICIRIKVYRIPMCQTLHNFQCQQYKCFS